MVNCYEKINETLVSYAMIVVVVLCIFALPTSAMSVEEEVTNPASLISTIYYSRSDCQKIYTQMTAYTSWTTSLINALADISGVQFLVEINYNSALSAFYKGGYVSGYTGCKLLVYDNAVPTVIAY